MAAAAIDVILIERIAASLSFLPGNHSDETSRSPEPAVARNRNGAPEKSADVASGVENRSTGRSVGPKLR
jgi:hypothetical protein